MRPLRYEGEIRQEGADFEVRVVLALPTEADARTVAQWLHDAIRQKVEATGGKLAPIMPGLTGIPRLLALTKAGLR